MREKGGDCRGGVLADEPGMGKTLTVVGHLVREKQKLNPIRSRLRFDNDSSDSEVESEDSPKPAPEYVISGKYLA